MKPDCLRPPLVQGAEDHPPISQRHGKQAGEARGSAAGSEAWTERPAEPAARLVAGSGLVVAIALSPLASSVALAASAAAVVLAALVFRPPPKRFLVGLLPGSMAIAGATLPLLWVAAEAQPGWRVARAGLALSAALMLGASFKTADFSVAIRSLPLPRTLATLIDTMVRQLAYMKTMLSRVILSRRLRGARGAGVSGEVLAAALSASASRAERISLAMQLRGANLFARRRTPWHVRDWFLVGFFWTAGATIHLASHLLLTIHS